MHNPMTLVLPARSLCLIDTVIWRCCSSYWSYSEWSSCDKLCAKCSEVFGGKRWIYLGHDIAVFGVVTPCNFVYMCQIFRETSCSHRQRVRVKFLTWNLSIMFVSVFDCTRRHKLQQYNLIYPCIYLDCMTYREWIRYWNTSWILRNEILRAVGVEVSHVHVAV